MNVKYYSMKYEKKKKKVKSISSLFNAFPVEIFMKHSASHMKNIFLTENNARKRNAS